MVTTTTDTATLDDVAALLRRIADQNDRGASLFVDRDELATMLRVGLTKLDLMRGLGQIGPAEVSVGGLPRWRRAEVVEWAANLTAGRLMSAKEWATFTAAKRRPR